MRDTNFPEATPIASYATMQQPGEKKMMMVDVNEFVRTRDAVSFTHDATCDSSVLRVALSSHSTTADMNTLAEFGGHVAVVEH